MNRRGTTQTVTIASSGTTSSTIDLVDVVTSGVILPAAFTGTGITFTVSADGTNFDPLNDEAGAAVTLAVAVDNAYTLPAALAPWPFARIVSNDTEAAARSLIIVSKQ